MQTTFKPADTLFARIKEDLYSFDAAGLIDEGRFYHHVKYILSTLGIKWFVNSEAVLDVSGFTTELPEDFQILEAAYRCEGFISDTHNSDGVVLKSVIIDQYASPCPDGGCNKGCEECGEECEDEGTTYRLDEHILIQRGDHILNYGRPVLLKLGNVATRRLCTEKCDNIYARSADTITIQDGKIHTNFEDGSIYLRYHAFPLDEVTGLPMIPDNPTIEKCIEYYIKKTVMESLWLNGDADVANKVSFIVAEYRDALAQAQHETKRPSFRAMVESVKRMKKSLRIYQF